ncbi:MAG: deoxyhypusine synthase [Thermoplasmata archaeon]
MRVHLKEKVRDYSIEGEMSCGALVAQMRRAGGFTAAKLAHALEILEHMVRREECITFLSFPAALMATGCRGVFVEMVKRKMVDVIITTCGTVDHDLVRVRHPYYHGDFYMDDGALHRAGIHRLGNVLVPSEAYGKGLEDRLIPFFRSLWDEGMKGTTTADLLRLAGERLGDESSLLYWCAKRDIPVIIPALTDGAFGYHLWSFWQEHRDFVVDVLGDESLLADIVFSNKETGALVAGGGVSKHHVLWWNQFKDGLDYAVYITTAVEYDGSLSGARVREAISWGKVKEGARRVTVEGDASLILPLLYAALVESLL